MSSSEESDGEQPVTNRLASSDENSASDSDNDQKKIDSASR